MDNQEAFWIQPEEALQLNIHEETKNVIIKYLSEECDSRSSGTTLDERIDARTGGIILKNNKILLCTEKYIDFWYIPGGGISKFETSEQALKREIEEELGISPSIERLLWFTENIFYFDYCKSNIHQLNFFYLINLAIDETRESFIINEKIQGEGKIKELHFKWFDIDNLQDIDLRPAFLKKALRSIPEHVQHVILKEI